MINLKILKNNTDIDINFISRSDILVKLGTVDISKLNDEPDLVIGLIRESLTKGRVLDFIPHAIITKKTDDDRICMFDTNDKTLIIFCDKKGAEVNIRGGIEIDILKEVFNANLRSDYCYKYKIGSLYHLSTHKPKLFVVKDREIEAVKSKTDYFCDLDDEFDMQEP